MNKVFLIGRLTKEPESFEKVTRFTLATDRKYKQEGGQQADFPSCVCFGKTAEFVNKYINKGMKIAVEGRLQTGSYTNKNGVKVYTTDVIVDSVEFCESKKSKDNEWMDVDVDEAGLPFD